MLLIQLMKVMLYQLQKMVNDINGISTKEKKVEQEDGDYEYKIRIGLNETLCAHTKEQMQILKNWYGL